MVGILMSGFANLHVWRKAHALAINVHSVVRDVRGSHYSSLRSQMIRASMSIPANIVEGRSQKSDRDFASLFDQNVEVRKMLHGLIKKIAEGGHNKPSGV